MKWGKEKAPVRTDTTPTGPPTWHQQRALFPKGSLEHHLTCSSAETSEKAPWHLIKHASVPASITGELKLRNSTHLRKETRPLGTSELQGVSISAVLASALKSSQWKKNYIRGKRPHRTTAPCHLVQDQMPWGYNMYRKLPTNTH